MLGIQLLLLGIVLLVVPVIIGTLFGKEKDGGRSLVFSWVSGQIVLWAGFLAICVPLILKEKPFTLVCNLFHIYTVLMMVVALILEGRRWLAKKKLERPSVIREEVWQKNKSRFCMWGIFWGLLLLQFVLTIFLAYEEGDDAFYIATATITEEADTMYIKLPYTGGTTGLDARHGLAPFPVWIAYLGRISGMAPVIVAQIVLSLTLIGMAYAIYYLIAKHLCAEKKKNIPFFMILVELLVMFGGYSVYSMENFLLVRASQGKAVIANIILPFLLYLIMLLLDNLQRKEKIGYDMWILMALTTVSGCLCSTLGTILTCMLLGVAGMCTAISYRNWKILVPMGLSCVVPFGMALLYFMIL